jgi:hypothetical protein
MIFVQYFEQVQIIREPVFGEHLLQFRLLEHMRKMSAGLKVRSTIRSQRTERQFDQPMPLSFRICPIPWVVTQDLEILK